MGLPRALSSRCNLALIFQIIALCSLRSDGFTTPSLGWIKTGATCKNVESPITTRCRRTQTSPPRNHHHNVPQNNQFLFRSTTTSLFASTDDQTKPLPNSSDPYIILNLQPTADPKEIKRAYKRMALKYHPDVRTNPSSTAEERKAANDDFSRINSAYAFLSGKSEDRPMDANGKSSSTAGSRGRPGSTGAGSGYGYTPPHRRSGADRSKSYSESNWKDYMPKYDEDEKYDAGGDSFGSIFSDLFTEVASGAGSSAAGSGGLLNDLISFLEGNFPSVGTNPTQRTEEDIILESLLRDGSKEEIKDELDDAKLLVKQLESKELNLDSELRIISKEREELSNSNRKGSTYMEDMGLEERRREVEARKSVVQEYLENARVRQIKLRRRYEELRSMDTGGERRSYTQERSRTSNDGPQSTSSSSTNRTYGEDTSTSGASSSSSDDDSWKRESFGSSRRSRGGSRGRSRGSSARTERATASSTSGGENPSAASERKSSNYSTSTGSSYGANSSTSSRRSTTSSPSPNSGAGATRNLPPHRRLTQTYQQKQEDKRRMREIKVDEEIDRMKEELGL